MVRLRTDRDHRFAHNSRSPPVTAIETLNRERHGAVTKADAMPAVAAGDVAQLAERIDSEELLRQRRTFSSAIYRTARTSKPRRGPFSP